VAVGRVSFGYLAKLRLLSLIVISFSRACERSNNDPVGVAKPIIGAWPGDRWERWRAEGLICKLEIRIIMGIDITTVEALIPTHDFLYKLIEKVTKTAVFGLDKIQERLGTNNQF